MGLTEINPFGWVSLGFLNHPDCVGEAALGVEKTTESNSRPVDDLLGGIVQLPPAPVAGEDLALPASPNNWPAVHSARLYTYAEVMGLEAPTERNSARS